ncbi:GDSL-type esterase/lipase family protein [Peribacillus sp. SCS-37]|uniref:GDSL-type esterase/lipase family protein n=1 Tax=Paraperibacillus esterisolvens TaxID=3115296 RepID=UPI0039068B27
MRIKYVIALTIVLAAITLYMSSPVFLNSSYGEEDNLSIYEKMEREEPLHYLVIGDSIGRGSGAETYSRRWFKQLEKEVYKKHGSKMTGSFLVQSGATSLEGLYKLQYQKVQGPIDLAFIVFGENDRKYMNADSFGRLYESVIRKVKVQYPSAEIVTITESCLEFPDFARRIDDLSKHYQTAHIDMRPVFSNSGYRESELTADGVHPTGQGYRLYAEAINQALNANLKMKKQPARSAAPLYPDSDLILASSTNEMTQKGFFFSNGYYTGAKKGSVLETSFTGTLLGVKMLRSPDGGIVDVYIDGKRSASLSTWWPFKRERIIYIADHLSPGRHTVSFKATGQKSASNKTDASVIRIGSIIEQGHK